MVDSVVWAPVSIQIGRLGIQIPSNFIYLFIFKFYFMQTNIQDLKTTKNKYFAFDICGK